MGEVRDLEKARVKTEMEKGESEAMGHVENNRDLMLQLATIGGLPWCLGRERKRD